VVNQGVDVLLQALADPSRRFIVERLATSSASVKELAGPLDMSLPAVMRHISVLETSGIVRSQKSGRVRTCEIDPAVFAQLESWIVTQRSRWEERLDDLALYLEEEGNADD
jgi:DNA-binding transcriptional ArsR family regulator